MPSVHLTKLRSQINAVAIHFQEKVDFNRSLISLLEFYSDQKEVGRDWYKTKSAITDLHVPHSVMAELDARLELLAKEHPDAALSNADILWAVDRYESKHAAISLLAGLAQSHQKQAIEKIRQWIVPDLDLRLMKEMIEAFKNRRGILLDKQWVDSLSNWLSKDDDELQRLGLKAISETIRMNYENLPQIFVLLTPVIQNPRISIQKELIDVIQALIERSEAEIASFMIMAGTLYPKKDVLAFIRKCLPMFDPFFQAEIKTSLS
jgi:hypothetical protein